MRPVGVAAAKSIRSAIWTQTGSCKLNPTGRPARANTGRFGEVFCNRAKSVRMRLAQIGASRRQFTFLNPRFPAPNQPVYVNINLDGQATTKVLHREAVQAVQDNPRVVQQSVSSAQWGSYGRRQAVATPLQPGTVLA
jgi:hypothetical protein